jgi:hypothetical protein
MLCSIDASRKMRLDFHIPLTCSIASDTCRMKAAVACDKRKIQVQATNLYCRLILLCCHKCLTWRWLVIRLDNPFSLSDSFLTCLGLKYKSENHTLLMLIAE